MSDEFWQRAFQRSDEAMLALDGDGTIVELNDAFLAMLGGARTDYVGTCSAAIVPKDDGTWAQLKADGRVRRVVTTTTSRGDEIVAEISGTMIEPGRALLFVRDVTERTVRELSAQRYQLLSRYAKDIVLFLARDGRIVEANEAAIYAYGYGRDALLALRIHDLREQTTVHNVETLLNEAFEAGARFTTTHRRKDGTTFPVEVSSRSAVIGGQWMLLSIIRDITHQTELHAQLVQADRLSAFGLMAAGIAHEINNPLAYAMTNGELLQRTMDRVKVELAGATPETAQTVVTRALGMLREREQSLETMREGLARVRTIVRDLSTFTRDDKAPQFVDVRAVLESTVRLSHGELEHRVRVVRDYDNVPHVVGHAARLGQVFLNLVINAAQAVEDGGTIEIRAESSDDAVMVDVKDDGPGIDAALRERIFQPFFTTKAAGKGTGLGLYISRTLVTEMGGTITALPSTPRGTIMRVTLPRARAGHL